jgi:SAM-dependent methyltransferase
MEYPAIFTLPIAVAMELQDTDTLQYGTNELAKNYYNHYLYFGQVYQPQRILELGVRYGYTALALLHGSKARHYTGLDIDADRLGTAGLYLRRLVHELLGTELLLLVGDVRDGLPGHHDPFDLVHCDAYHEDVRVELALAHRHVRSGGVVIVDDCRAELVRGPAEEFFTRHSYSHSYLASLTGQVIGVKP